MWRKYNKELPEDGEVCLVRAKECNGWDGKMKDGYLYRLASYKGSYRDPCRVNIDFGSKVIDHYLYGNPEYMEDTEQYLTFTPTEWMPLAEVCAFIANDNKQEK